MDEPFFQLVDLTNPLMAVDQHESRCMFPLTQHVAREPSKDSPTQSATGQWSLYEDRPNKPGWISTTENLGMSIWEGFKNPKCVHHISVFPGLETIWFPMVS